MAKKKLEKTQQNLDKWAEDQKEPLNEYLTEKEKIEQSSFKDIESFKDLNEMANQKYLLSLKRYNTLIKFIEELKVKIDNLASEKYSYDINSRLLLKCYELLDTFKFEISKWEFEKNKRRQQMQDYLFIIEQKKDELIKNLSEKLKLSVNFIKNNDF